MQNETKPELKELTESLLSILELESTKMLPEKLFQVVRDNDFQIYEKFVAAVPDLGTDWLQMVFQYYLADRKVKMQDYTPKSLARFAGKLMGSSEVIVDLCAGSGALSIQSWVLNPDARFELYELDETVIPFLLFNMAARNIACIVFHSDVLLQEVFHVYKIEKGERFGRFMEVEKNEKLYFQSTV